MADRLAAELTDLGLEVNEDNAPAHMGRGTAGNLHAWWPGQHGQPLLFCAHMDTVGPCTNKKILCRQDGRIETDGTSTLGADDLAGVVSILEAIRSIREDAAEHHPVEVLFTVGEEHFLSGSTALDPSSLVAGEGYVLDVDGPIGTAVLAAPTGFRILAEVHGRSAHAGLSPETGVNAISAAAQAIARIPWGRLDEETTANVGIIHGGSAGNIVPEHCTVEMETRSLSNEKALAQVRRIRTAFEDAARAFQAEAEVTETRQLSAYHVSRQTSVVQRFAAACANHNIRPNYLASCGGSDNTVLSQHGLQCIVIAPGMHEIHSVNEWTTLQELTTMSRITQDLMCLD